MKNSIVWIMVLVLVFVAWPLGSSSRVEAASGLSDLGISNTVPASGSVDVDGVQPLTLEFSQAVKKGTGNITIKRISDNKEAMTPIPVSGNTVQLDTSADPDGVLGTKVTVSNLNLATGGYYVLIEKGAFLYGDNTEFSGINDASYWTFWTTGIGAPALNLLSPLHGATGVQPSANLKITFSKDVYPASGSISIYNNSDDVLVETIPVTSSQITGGGTPTITIDPANNFVNNNSYYVVVTAGAFRDAQQNESSTIAKGSWRFSVSTDTTALKVSSLYPTDGATSAPTDSDLKITFNKELDPAYIGKITLHKSNGAVVEVTTAINGSNLRQVLITPSSQLDANTTYYVDVAAGGFRDKAGNVFAGLTGTSSWSFKTLTKDTTAPVFQKAKMHNNTTVRLIYNETLSSSVRPLTSSFVVTVNGEARDVSSAYVSGDSVYVVLDTGVAVGQIVRVSYTPGIRSIQDKAGNIAASISGREVENGLDSVMSKPEDGDVYGNSLTLYFSETVYVKSSSAVNQFTVTADGNNVGIKSISISSSSVVSLTLSRNIKNGEVIKISYTPDAYPLEDSRSQALAGFSDFYIRNNLDGIAPVFQKAEVNGSKLTIKYNEALSTTNVPLKSQFSVLVNNAPLYVTAVEIQDDTVTLTLASAITSNQNATLSYVPGALRLTDLNGNPAGYINLVPITQTSGTGNVKSAVIQGDTVTVTFTSNLLTQTGLTNSQFVVKANGTAVNVLTASSSGISAVLKLSTSVAAGQTVTLSYAPEYVPLRDSQSQVVGAFGPITLTNNGSGSTTGSTTLPAWLSVRDAVLFGQSMYVLSTDAATSSSVQSRYGRSVHQYTVDADKLTQGFQYAASLGGELNMLTFDVPTTDTAAYVALPLKGLEDSYARDRNTVIGIRLADQLWTIPLSKLNFTSIANSVSSTTSEAKLVVQIEPVPSTVSGAMDGLLIGANAQKLSALTDVYIAASSPIKSSVEQQVDSELWMRLSGTATSGTTGFVQFDKTIARLSNVPHTPVQLNGALVLRGKLTGNQTVVAAQHIVRFSDTTSHWAGTVLEELAAKWIIDGQTGTNYQPDMNITRAEFAVMVAKGLGLTGSQETAQRFGDVAYGTTTSAYIGAAAKAGIITGNTDGTFKPNNLITREQMAIMMVRALDYGGKPVTLKSSAAATLTKFKDNKKVQSKEEVAKAVQEGIIQGMTSTTFQPTGNATRAQAAVMLKRVLIKIGYL
ncbi:Ig-like domain-containing protein [Paenibacillus xylanilyticus]|uniref:Ig-like domain-containing protein n=1 Tax=Paenibacillus xylanilyticus TaxID=248903 RepID=UPI00399F5E12